MNKQEYEMIIKGYKEEISQLNSKICSLENRLLEYREKDRIQFENLTLTLNLLKVLKEDGYDVKAIYEKANGMSRGYADIERIYDKVLEEVREIIWEIKQKEFDKYYSNLEGKLQAVKEEIQEMLNDTRRI